MSKYMSYICDICGTEIVGHSAQAVAAESAQLKLWPPGEYRAGPGQRIDFLPGMLWPTCRILRKRRTKR